MTTKKNGYISIDNALAMLHPVGSCIILSDETDPNEIFSGTTWELIGQDKCIIGAGNKFTAMQDIPAGLPNITGAAGLVRGAYGNVANSAMYLTSYKFGLRGEDATTSKGLNFDASRCNSIYGSSDTIQPPSIALFIWRRTA